MVASAVSADAARPDRSEQEAWIWELLEAVPDPEIPVVSIVDLGIVRHVHCAAQEVTVTLTPTYSGCPATRAIEQSVREQLQTHGVQASLKTVFSPPWTTDWIRPDARERLQAYGISPPERRSGPPPCPFCESTETQLQSEFGSTPCKALHRCKSCLQPFEQFKCV